MTKQQFIELHNKMLICGRGRSIEELLEKAIMDGIVEDNNDRISIQKNDTGDS